MIWFETVYGLHAGDGNIRYVGRSQNPQERLRRHKCAYNAHNPALTAWVKANKKALQYVVLDVLRGTPDWPWPRDTGKVEYRWIRRLRKRGIPLFNIQPWPKGQHPYTRAKGAA